MTNRVDSVLRAAACARLRAVAEAEGLPAIDPQASFLDHVRHLYENSALPVREIARIAGIIERTLYSYVRKGGWQRRNWRHARYLGGRIVAAEEAGFPAVRGRASGARNDARGTALDYLRARRLTRAADAAAAAAAKERAARLDAERIARAARDKTEARLSTLGALNRVLDRMLAEQDRGGVAVDSAVASANSLAMRALLDQLAVLRKRGD